MKTNFEEIKEKAKYCLNCKNKPCKSGCPLQNNIPDFINCIKEEKYKEAFEILSQTTIFEPICGRICPHKKQCEGSCVRGIKGKSVSIGELETFIGDFALNNIDFRINNLKDNSKKVAIIGSGPAGLACSYLLAKNGYKVSIFERHSKLGGLLRYGIPDFRLDKSLLDKWLQKFIINNNIEINVNTEFGKDISMEELERKFDYIILSFGANVSSKMNILGKDLDFVLGGNELLEYGNMPDFNNKEVAIIGGGNVAIDSARTIKRLGAKKVKIIYRRSEVEMPAETKEIEAAKYEGIDFLFQTNILRAFYENQSPKIECIETKLVQKEGESRKVPVNIKNSNYLINVDYVLMAIGSKPNDHLLNMLNLETNKWGYINVDENCRTSNEKVYAIGDIAGNKQSVAWAARSGFDCARSIMKLDIKH